MLPSSFSPSDEAPLPSSAPPDSARGSNNGSNNGSSSGSSSGGGSVKGWQSFDHQRTDLASLAAAAACMPLPPGMESAGDASKEGKPGGAAAVKPEGASEAAAEATVRSASSSSSGANSSIEGRGGGGGVSGLPTPKAAASLSLVLLAQQGSQQHQPQQPSLAAAIAALSAASCAAAASSSSHSTGSSSSQGQAAPTDAPQAQPKPRPRLPTPSTASLVAALRALPPELCHFLSGEKLDAESSLRQGQGQGQGGAQWPAAAAVCGVVWYDGGPVEGGLLPRVVCNEPWATMLMSKKRVEAAVLGEGRRPEHVWEKYVTA